ncbi:hypothetical protein OPT61_g3760 [Boeremia exigua]|uniref:Uncharacterized protein n=1 Tax=Boeremia exigua TaxID=749465 RepID=A0ACC2IGQ5_9PLEO|nr:hypothetical protein OPT61_g3760 [Boeremia exigua]
MSHTALFVIDIQNSLACDPSTQIPHASRILSAGTSLLARTRGAIDSARARDEPTPVEVVVVQHEEGPEKGALQRGSQAWGVAFPPRENDPDERLVAKDVRDTFHANPRLADELRERGVRTVVAFGIQSECCVLSTCLGALEAGFEVVLLKGAHSTYDGNDKAAREIEREVEERVVNAGARVVDWKAWKP